MGFNLIGLGLDINSITIEAKQAIEKSNKVYLERYTVDFPYTKKELEKKLEKKIIPLNRENVEDESILEEARNSDIALLVYGDSLSATTHTQLILSCKKNKIKYKVYHNASIINAIAQTGLQLYKFGKTASMPQWKKNYTPTSFLNYYKENKSISAHTLLLTDIGLEIKQAIEQLEEASKKEKQEIEKIIVISNAGLENQKIYYDTLEKIKKINLQKPYCIIIPDKLHFIEEEALNEFKEKLIN